jgi:hypothetical protein
MYTRVLKAGMKESDPNTIIDTHTNNIIEERKTINTVVYRAMRVLLFHCAVFLFMVGLVSLLFLNGHSPTWLVILVIFSMISGGISAAILSCVVPERRHEEMEPLKPPEIERVVETL